MDRWASSAIKPTPRFFAPDQPTPGLEKQPWWIGDVFCFVHGPDIRNLYAFEVIEVKPDGKIGNAKVVPDVRFKFLAEITAFFKRKGYVS